VHVFERSSRLGGKGASTRDPANGRIYEHGLHVWLGFYENAFRMMRECYAEVEFRKWGPKAKTREARLAHKSIDDAFFPEPNIGVAGDLDEQLNVWSGFLPPAKGLPGTALDPDSNPFTLPSYLARCVSLLKTLMLSVVAPAPGGRAGDPRPDQRSQLDEAQKLNFSYDPVRSPTAVIERIARLLRTGVLTTSAGLLQAVTLLENWVHGLNQSPQVPDTILQLIEAIVAQMRKLLHDVVAIDERMRWKTEIIDIVMTITVGLFRDRVLFSDRGLDAINNFDYREWLLKHGATHTSVNSRFMKGIYDLVFAYDEGVRTRHALAAGVALRGALRMFFTYRGSMFWRLRSGMGDAVFAPLYKVMLQDARYVDGERRDVRPVQFHFLHELTRIDIDWRDKNARFVTGLEFATKGNPDALDKLGHAALDDFGGWPHDGGRFKDVEPTAMRFTTDYFDAVVFALGIDDLKKVCANPATAREFVRNMPRNWRKMQEDVTTVATQSAQVWLDADLEKLGWKRGSGIFTALDMPFNTWADMTHTLATERAWRELAGKEPKTTTRSVAYFCGVVPDRGKYTGQEEEKVPSADENLDKLLRERIDKLWPEFKGTVAAGDRHATDNNVGSDRFTLSRPGTIGSRISPLARDVLNMTIAGDWTACGLDVGCVEAAVMSGMLAAHALTNDDPALDTITGYDHP
jgi:uncharacterized protein with NAD-binding domain and iron-sulfur cluster